MDYLEFCAHIKNAACGNEALKPIYFVGGDDAYLRQEVTATFKGLVDVDYADFNLSYVSQNDGVSSAVDALQLFPMFADLKVVIMPDCNAKFEDDDMARLHAYLLNPNPTSVLAVIFDGISAGDVAKKEGITYVNCDKLNRDDAYAEIRRILSAFDKDIDRNAFVDLYDRTEGDMSRMATEAQKLAFYCEDRITLKDVGQMVSPNLNFAAYEFTGAVSDKDADKALLVLNSMYKQGLKGVAIITMLFNQYRRMLHAELHKNDSNEELAKLLDMKPNALYYLKRVSGNYSQMRLKKCVDYLHSLQVAVLSGKINENVAVNEAILTLLNI